MKRNPTSRILSDKELVEQLRKSDEVWRRPMERDAALTCNRRYAYTTTRWQKARQRAQRAKQ